MWGWGDANAGCPGRPFCSMFQSFCLRLRRWMGRFVPCACCFRLSSLLAGWLLALWRLPFFRCWYPLLAHCFVLAAAACIACPLDSACFLSCVFAGSDVLAVSLLRVDGVPFFWDGMVPWDGFFGGDAVGLGMHFRVSVSRYVWVTYRILI